MYIPHAASSMHILPRPCTTHNLQVSSYLSPPQPKEAFTVAEVIHRALPSPPMAPGWYQSGSPLEALSRLPHQQAACPDGLLRIYSSDVPSALARSAPTGFLR
jgi:hypothetical protein